MSSNNWRSEAKQVTRDGMFPIERAMLLLSEPNFYTHEIFVCGQCGQRAEILRVIGSMMITCVHCGARNQIPTMRERARKSA